MANKGQLSILLHGVDKWNWWRETFPNIVPDLSDLAYDYYPLYKRNLMGVNFGGVDLQGTSLGSVNLRNSDCREANLSEAILHSALLISADLRKVNLTNATLTSAILNMADLRGAILRGTNLILARFINTNLTGADLTGACLYGSAREDWIIDDIKCDYIYFDINHEIRTPKSRNFRPGEFELLYKNIPTLEYIFENGITPLDTILMDRIVQSINERNPEFDLKLDSFHSRGSPRAVFTVLHKEIADEALSLIKSEYENRVALITAQYDTLKDCYQDIIGRLPMGDTYNIYGQTASVGPGAHAHDIEFNQLWKEVGHNIDLNQLAKELSQLRTKAQKEAQTPDNFIAVAEITSAEIAAKEGKGTKVLEHLKKAGIWALDVSKNIGIALATEVIKRSMGL
ncbi:putative Pentapeptide repeat protein [uncultured Desulfobacterium sp.]|uniref:Putative Pentapeptide repeat protein n=1 Tax=uncultured Desulfobacterium sp. TaxID=201089 RepID=A0A445N2T1_9BACT|nr:putative Pentapeptide repeat protein [uncultured Desulfobacterium sp.]